MPLNILNIALIMLTMPKLTVIVQRRVAQMLIAFSFFLQTNRKYYDDCAHILSEHMLMAVKPRISNFLLALA